MSILVFFTKMDSRCIKATPPCPALAPLLFMLLGLVVNMPLYPEGQLAIIRLCPTRRSGEEGCGSLASVNATTSGLVSRKRATISQNLCFL